MTPAAFKHQVKELRLILLLLPTYTEIVAKLHGNLVPGVPILPHISEGKAGPYTGTNVFSLKTGTLLMHVTAISAR